MPNPLSLLRRLPHKANRALHHEAMARLRRQPIRSDTVLYEAFAGSGMLDNPEAIYRELRSSPEFDRLTHVWAIADGALLRRLRAEHRGDAAVRFVRRRSLAYWRTLCTAGWLVNNATFPPDFGKRPGQTYLNTWHGTPLKRMGYDMPNGAYEAANTLRNFVAADYLLAQNSFMTEAMYAKAYKLAGVFRGVVVEEGYPRVDRQRLSPEQAGAARALLASRGVELGQRRVVLYAPTWKGETFSRPADDIAELVGTVRKLQDRLGDDYAVVLKTHQSVFRFARRDPLLQRILIPNDVPTNVVLGLADVLVTDYSSIQFDFLATGRPLVFHIPELDSYESTRGLYYPPEDWPGPVTTDVDELAAAIRDHVEPAHASAWRQRFSGLDDGRAASRVVDAVFRGSSEGRRLRRLDGERRRSVLFYLGGMRSNGITSSAVNLVNALPAQEWDVSVAFTRSQRAEVRGNAGRLAPHVRQFQRQGGMNATRVEHLRRKGAIAAGELGSEAVERVWRDEWLRLFGDLDFDVVVDFSGYGPFWTRLLLSSPPARRLVWLHNDMAKDAERTVEGHTPLRRGLNAVFRLYRHYEWLVSVSERLSAINAESLARHADAGRFVTMRNLIDAAAFRRAAELPLEDVAAIAPESNELAVPAVERMLADSGRPWFATVGRLSPEKNHERLVEAFERVHAVHPETRLLIVGDGPLRQRLADRVAASAAAAAIVLAGAFTRPAPLVAACSCFVMSSDYEGQPMVLLEAASLGKPIVSTRFGTAEDALPGSNLLIVERNAEALAEGMLAFLRGEVLPNAFDDAAYNAGILRRFAELAG